MVKIELITPRVKIETEEREVRLKREEETLRRYIGERDFLVVLDERGKSFNTIELTNFISQSLEIHQSLCLVVGGPFGISENLKKQARELLSLSPLTLNHEIALLVLFETLYRCLSILKKIPYHKF